MSGCGHPLQGTTVFHNSCPVNIYEPHEALLNSPDVSYKKTMKGPTSVKHLYNHTPNYYPYIHEKVPIPSNKNYSCTTAAVGGGCPQPGILYDVDTSVYRQIAPPTFQSDYRTSDNSASKNMVNNTSFLEHGQLMISPVINYSPREIRDYAGYILPIYSIRNWTQYPVLSNLPKNQYQ